MAFQNKSKIFVAYFQGPLYNLGEKGEEVKNKAERSKDKNKELFFF